jgi:hypothetical protein
MSGGGHWASCQPDVRPSVAGVEIARWALIRMANHADMERQVQPMSGYGHSNPYYRAYLKCPQPP